MDRMWGVKTREESKCFQGLKPPWMGDADNVYQEENHYMRNWFKGEENESSTLDEKLHPLCPSHWTDTHPCAPRHHNITSPHCSRWSLDLLWPTQSYILWPSTHSFFSTYFFLAFLGSHKMANISRSWSILFFKTYTLFSLIIINFQICFS